MDNETGEKLRDSETGETPAKPQLNSETGEREITCVGPKCKRPFKIPKSYMKTEPEEAVQMTKQVARGLSPVILFLMPTVFFVPVVAIFLGATELFLHIWAHKKNKSLKTKAIYYQSPLHVIASEFCATCIDESMKNKISEMQDKRNNKFTRNSAEYFRRIVT